MKAIIFSGGVGSRMWPLSRKNSPKQFNNHVDDRSMFQLAIDRLRPELAIEDIYVSTGRQYKDFIRSQIPELPEENIILEPEMRDVGPAVGLIAATFALRFPGEPLAILWSDHFVKDTQQFKKLLKEAEEYVLEHPEQMVFMGQEARFPTPNLGWINLAEKVQTNDKISTYRFAGWHYRPPLTTAKEYFQDGHHAWNPGYFMTTSTHLYDLYKRHAPEMYADLNKIQRAIDTPDYQSTLNKMYPGLEKIHFDNVILDRIPLDSAIVMVTDFGWSDVGSFEQLKEALEESPTSNVTKGDVVTLETTDSFIYNLERGKLVVAIDLDNVVIVNTPDVTLVVKKTSVGKIKDIVTKLKEDGREELI